MLSFQKFVPDINSCTASISELLFRLVKEQSSWTYDLRKKRMILDLLFALWWGL
jgi:hypothetical protein